MNKFAIIALLMLTKNSNVINAKKIEKILSVSVIEEEINSMRFTHRSDLVDGKASEIWAINGHQVGYEEYEEAILNAEKEERRAFRAVQAEKRKQEQEFKTLSHYNLLKKLINLKIGEINKELVRVQDPLLYSYLQYNQHSIGSESALIELQQVLENAQAVCAQSKVEDSKQLDALLEKIDRYPEKLQKLYQDSVNYAIKTCDNTRVLKELLAMVSE